MTNHRLARALAIVAAAAFAVTACGGNTSTPLPATVAPVTQAPTVTTPPTAAPASPGFSFALPSGLNADTDLEALLPDELAGEPIQKLSMTGESFVGTGQGTEEIEQMLTALGKTPSDLSVAFGGNASVVLIAFRVKGVDANVIYQAVVAAQQQDDNVITDVTIAGKPAKKVVDAIETSTYLYLTGDALVTVTGVGSLDDTLLTEIFTKLP
jgi:hypothetical protein